MNVLHIMSQVLVVALITLIGVSPGMPTGGLVAFASAAEQTMNRFSRGTGFADIIEAVRPAVVNISIKRHPQRNNFQRFPKTQERYGYPAKPFFRRFFERQNWRADLDATKQLQASGSGFIIDPAGIVLTNHHVVDGATEIVVTLEDGTELVGSLLGTDAKTDLALLTVEGESSLPFVSFGDSDAVRVGDWVLAIGNPFRVRWNRHARKSFQPEAAISSRVRSMTFCRLMRQLTKEILVAPCLTRPVMSLVSTRQFCLPMAAM